ncbi:hypothetical protein BDY19DRAFT_958651, partial [Irpex rosettiformis]
MLRFLVLSGTLILCVSGALVERPQTNCEDLGPGASNTAKGFRLRAYNISHVDNGSVPLGYFPLGSEDSSAGLAHGNNSILEQLGTFDGYSSNLDVTWTLYNGVLVPDTYQPIVNNAITDGGRLTWTLGPNLTLPISNYCAVVSSCISNAQFYLFFAHDCLQKSEPGRNNIGFHDIALAVNGDPNSFYLCEARKQSQSQANVFFKLDRNSDSKETYCYPIMIQLVFGRQG